MKKICNITIISDNYGNRLQNYALQKVLSELDVYAESVFPEVKFDMQCFVKNIVKEIIIKILPNTFAYYQRKKNFDLFNKKYINKSSYKQQNIEEKCLDEYDFVICGSDQIWNCNFDFFSEYYFATFFPKKKKIAYAASFGIEVIPELYRNNYRKWLGEFKDISVREKQGLDIIKELEIENAEVVVDPTFMLSAEMWRGIIKKPKANNGRPYIFKYFLGKQSKRDVEHIQQIANDNGLQIFDIMNKEDVKVYKSGPREFIELIDNAMLICTDSFHACVFSIIFNKPFLLFNRDGTGAGMGSRISGLLSMLELEHRMPGVVSQDAIFEHDYKRAYELLEKEREKALKFLRKSLEIS